MIQLTHSKKLSKRLKKDQDFRSLLFPQLRKVQKLEEGILAIQYNKSEHTLFSELNQVDTEEALCKFAEGKITERTKAVISKFRLTQSLLEKKRLKKLKWYAKILTLKPISNKSNPKLLQDIRFFEYGFPLDYSIFAVTSDKSSKLFKILGNLYDHKKALSVTFDKEKKQFSIESCEKFFSSKDLANYSFSIQKYYIEWLRNSGNAKALPFIESQLKFKDYHKNNKESELEFFENEHKYKNDKFFIKTISKDDMEFIFKSPYMTRTHKRDLHGTNEDNGLVQEEFNMELCKLIGYQDTDKLYRKEPVLQRQQNW